MTNALHKSVFILDQESSGKMQSCIMNRMRSPFYVGGSIYLLWVSGLFTLFICRESKKVAAVLANAWEEKML